MLRKLSLLVLVVLGAWLGFAATRPDTFHVERSIRVQGSPEQVFALLENFQQWKKWSPWEAKDPAMKRELSGTPSGVGAVYAWSGNSDVGTGRMEISEAQSPTKLVIQLEFSMPFEAHNVATFTLVPRESGTDVTWEMRGPSPYLSKVIQTIFPIDRMVGPDFERGLAQLKQVVESGPKRGAQWPHNFTS
jgi:uncharacterized protein YndB with AHSA1/START domain